MYYKSYCIGDEIIHTAGRISRYKSTRIEHCTNNEKEILGKVQIEGPTSVYEDDSKNTSFQQPFSLRRASLALCIYCLRRKYAALHTVRSVCSSIPPVPGPGWTYAHYFRLGGLIALTGVRPSPFVLSRFCWGVPCPRVHAHSDTSTHNTHGTRGIRGQLKLSIVRSLARSMWEAAKHFHRARRSGSVFEVHPSMHVNTCSMESSIF